MTSEAEIKKEIHENLVPLLIKIYKDPESKVFNVRNKKTWVEGIIDTISGDSNEKSEDEINLIPILRKVIKLLFAIENKDTAKLTERQVLAKTKAFLNSVYLTMRENAHNTDSNRNNRIPISANKLVSQQSFKDRQANEGIGSKKAENLTLSTRGGSFQGVFYPGHKLESDLADVKFMQRHIYNLDLADDIPDTTNENDFNDLHVKYVLVTVDIYSSKV